MERGSIFSSKRGQVTVFIIIAVLIVVAAVLVYILVPKASTESSFNAKNPQGFIQSCLQKTLEQDINNISLQGGSLNPESYYPYMGSNVEYLCYTNEYYQTCVVQQPALQQHVESEIKNAISGSIGPCFDNLQQNYRNDGYTTNVATGKTIVDILPGKTILSLENYTLTVTKGGTSVYDSFSIVLNNNLYELIGIANSILQWEATYGDAPVETYMTYYEDLQVEKILKSDGTKIYILTNTNTGDKFQFASRSVVFPPGYATNTIPG